MKLRKPRSEMIECLYNSDKRKKQKKWQDGFIRISDISKIVKKSAKKSLASSDLTEERMKTRTIYRKRVKSDESNNSKESDTEKPESDENTDEEQRKSGYMASVRIYSEEKQQVAFGRRVHLGEEMVIGMAEVFFDNWDLFCKMEGLETTEKNEQKQENTADLRTKSQKPVEPAKKSFKPLHTPNFTAKKSLKPENISEDENKQNHVEIQEERTDTELLEMFNIENEE